MNVYIIATSVNMLGFESIIYLKFHKTEISTIE